MENEQHPSSEARRYDRRQAGKLILIASIFGLSACSKAIENAAATPTPPPQATSEADRIRIEADFLRKAAFRDLKDRAMRKGDIENLTTFEPSQDPGKAEYTLEIFKQVESATYVISTDNGPGGSCFAVAKDETGIYIVLTRHQVSAPDGSPTKITELRSPKLNSPLEVQITEQNVVFSETSDIAMMRVELSPELHEQFEIIKPLENQVPLEGDKLLIVGYPEDMRLGYEQQYVTHGQVITVIDGAINLSPDGASYDFEGLVNPGSSGSVVAKVIDGKPYAVGYVKSYPTDTSDPNIGRYYHLEDITKMMEKLKSSK